MNDVSPELSESCLFLAYIFLEILGCGFDVCFLGGGGCVVGGCLLFSTSMSSTLLQYEYKHTNHLVFNVKFKLIKSNVLLFKPGRTKAPAECYSKNLLLERVEKIRNNNNKRKERRLGLSIDTGVCA
jgi:hypothetical protein